MNDYHMNSEAGNLSMAALEKTIRAHDAAFLASAAKMNSEDYKQCMEICDEGVQSFVDAGKDCAPLQNLVVGLAFTLKALENWRKLGPLGDGIAGKPPL